MSFTGYILLACICLLLNTSCSERRFSPEEAIRSLKVLNGDVSNLLTRAGEMEEWTALRFIWDHDSVPLPFPSEKFAAGKAWQPYSFDAAKGEYTWNEERQLFIRKRSAEAVKLQFSTGKIPEGEFILSDYTAAKTSSRPDFPLLFKSILKLKGEERVTIDHTATIADDLPEKIRTSVKTNDSGLSFSLGRTRTGSSGDLNIAFLFRHKGLGLIDSHMDAKIGYSNMGYFFEDIKLEIKIFNHLISGTICYGKIDPTSKDYAASFNRNADIRIFEMPGSRLVGKLILGKSPEGDLLDYFILLNDGSRIPVSEHLPFLDKLLNMKL